MLWILESGIFRCSCVVFLICVWLLSSITLYLRIFRISVVIYILYMRMYHVLRLLVDWNYWTWSKQLVHKLVLQSRKLELLLLVNFQVSLYKSWKNSLIKRLFWCNSNKLVKLTALYICRVSWVNFVYSHLDVRTIHLSRSAVFHCWCSDSIFVVGAALVRCPISCTKFPCKYHVTVHIIVITMSKFSVATQ